MENLGSKFLHDRNPSLHNSSEVDGIVGYLRANGEQIPNEPIQKIENYLGFLANEEYVNDGILTGSLESINRQVEAQVITGEEVPERYFDLQRRIAREQGHGDITITDTMREQLVDAVQSNQRSRLEKWAEYLGGDDGSYPNWFKHYAWKSVTKLGSYDKEKGEFLKRSKGTTAPYPELNHEALAYVFDGVHKKANGETVISANDQKLQELLQAANFGRLYSHAIIKLQPASPEQKEVVEGSWTKYEQSYDPRAARRLAGSLQGHGTGWCTAGESTAQIHLKSGDFYVYYTGDDDNKDTVPRVAIRMQGGKVAEVRGINHAQELEPAMTSVALERLEDLPGGEDYTQKAEDMKRLTILERKLTENPEAVLSREEVAFLYQVERSLQGFGYRQDPRAGELAGRRDIVKDMATLFGTDPEDTQATINAMIEAESERKYQNLSVDRVIGQCAGLSSEFAEQLISINKSYLVSSHLESFSGLSDEIAQQFISNIRGLDIASFSQLSEHTFFMLADEFKKYNKYRDWEGKDRETHVLCLLQKAAEGKFDLPNHQRAVSRLMDKGFWDEAAMSPKYFEDLDTGAVADRMIKEGKLVNLVCSLENFPTVNHRELAEMLVKDTPVQLAWTLHRLNVDRNVYARKIIEAGKINVLYNHVRYMQSYDQDILDAFKAYKDSLEERAEAHRKHAEEWENQHAEYEREEEQRLANWDYTWGDPHA